MSNESQPSGIELHFQNQLREAEARRIAEERKARLIALGELTCVEPEERPRDGASSDREMIRESMRSPTRRKSEGGGSRSKGKSKKKRGTPVCATHHVEYCECLGGVGERLSVRFDAKLQIDHALLYARSEPNGLRFAHVLDAFLLGVERLERRLPDVVDLDLKPDFGLKPDLGVKPHQTSSFTGNPRGWGRANRTFHRSFRITPRLEKRLKEFLGRVRRAQGEEFSNAEVARLAFELYIEWCQRPQAEQGTDWASSLEEYRRIRDRLQTLSRT